MKDTDLATRCEQAVATTINTKHGGTEMKTQYTFRVEMIAGEDFRMVDADSYYADEQWLVFQRSGHDYWRASMKFVVSMEIIHND